MGKNKTKDKHDFQDYGAGIWEYLLIVILIIIAFVALVYPG